MLIVTIILLALLLILAGISWALAGFSLGGKRQTLEEARQWQESHYDLAWYDALEKEDYTIPGDGGYVLHVQRLINPAADGKYVIISHGYTDNRLGALKYARLYLDRGYQVIVYDLRGHGLNEPAPCTYSIREGRDLAALIRDTKERYPDLAVLGLHGESLGAASTISSLQYRPGVDFAVADCAFSDIRPVLKVGLKGMHLPGFLVSTASLAARLRCGYSYGQMRPIEALKGDHTPILFMHGAEDDFILPAHSEELHRAAGDHSRLCLIPGAKHAGSVLKAPQLYREKLYEYLDSLGKSY